MTPPVPARKASRNTRPQPEAAMRNDPEPPLTPAETRDLQRVAAMMVPASADYDVPGADDPAIFADIVKSIGRDMADVRKALGALCESANAPTVTVTLGFLM